MAARALAPGRARAAGCRGAAARTERGRRRLRAAQQVRAKSTKRPTPRPPTRDLVALGRRQPLALHNVDVLQGGQAVRAAQLKASLVGGQAATGCQARAARPRVQASRRCCVTPVPCCRPQYERHARPARTCRPEGVVLRSRFSRPAAQAASHSATGRSPSSAAAGAALQPGHSRRDRQWATCGHRVGARRTTSRPALLEAPPVTQPLLTAAAAWQPGPPPTSGQRGGWGPRGAPLRRPRAPGAAPGGCWRRWPQRPAARRRGEVRRQVRQQRSRPLGRGAAGWRRRQGSAPIRPIAAPHLLCNAARHHCEPGHAGRWARGRSGLGVSGWGLSAGRPALPVDRWRGWRADGWEERCGVVVLRQRSRCGSPTTAVGPAACLFTRATNTTAPPTHLALLGAAPD